MNKKNRRTHLEELKGERRTMIFYEAPHKLCATLDDLAEAFGPGRRISLCPGADQAPRGGAAHHPWGGRGVVRGQPAPWRVRAGGRGRGRDGGGGPYPRRAGWPGWRRCGPRASPCGTQCGRRRGKQAWLKMNFTTVPWGKPAAANKTVRKKGHPYLEVFGIENITICIIGETGETPAVSTGKKDKKRKKTPCFFRKARCFYNMKRIVILTEALECSWDRRSFP